MPLIKRKPRTLREAIKLGYCPKARSAFAIFLATKLLKGAKKPTHTFKTVGMEWRQMADERKKKYIQQAAEEKKKQRQAVVAAGLGNLRAVKDNVMSEGDSQGNHSTPLGQVCDHTLGSMFWVPEWCKKVGQGSYGRVVTAIDTRSGIKVCAKLYHGDPSHRSKDTENEVVSYWKLLDQAGSPPARYLLQLDRGVGSDHFLKPLAWSFEEINFLVLPLVPGLTLSALSQMAWKQASRYYDTATPEGLANAKGLFIQIGNAFGFLHGKDLVHLDVKSNNVMVEPKTGHVVVLDLGCCQISHTHPRCSAFYNRHYRAPEMGWVSKVLPCNVVPEADSFAAAVTLHEALTGTIIFQASEKPPRSTYKAICDFCFKHRRNHQIPSLLAAGRLAPILRELMHPRAAHRLRLAMMNQVHAKLLALSHPELS